MTKIYLVRHAQSTFNLERRIQGQMESELTDKGREQASILGKKLSDIKFSALYVSPMKRTKETAHLITKGWELETIYCNELKEILMGDWQGILVDELKERFPREMEIFWHHPELFNKEGCETYLQVRNRAAKLLEQIVEKHRKGNILVVTHGALLKTLYTYFNYQTIHDIANAPHPHSTGVCIVEKKNGVWNIHSWDDYSHLTEEQL